MLNKVLVPLDGSDLSVTAIEHAKSVIPEGATVILLMVIEPINAMVYADAGSSIFVNPDLPDPEAVSRNILNRHATTLTDKGHTIETLVIKGDPATSILDFAESAEVDAIIMTTHGRTGIERWLMGSVTQKVLGHAKCPVFVIPAKSL